MAEEQAQTTVTQEKPVSAEDRLAQAAGLRSEAEVRTAEETAARERDDRGRFVGQQQQQAEQTQTQQQAQQTEETQQAEAGEQEYKWDELKGIKLKIPMKNGEKEWEDEITLEQLRSERMMHSDYQARRKALDEEARQHESKAREAVEKERHAYLTTLETLHQSIVQAAAPELGNVDWTKLAQENPAEYVRLSNRAREVNSALERVRFEHEKATRQQAKDREDQLAKAVSESQAKLREAIPNWNDDLYQSLQKRGVETYGFKPEEVGQVWDHRVMQVLHDAHQFRLLKEQKPKTEETVKKLPPVLKPGAQKPKVDPKAQEFQKARENLRANPRSSEAATDVMRAFVTPSQR